MDEPTRVTPINRERVDRADPFQLDTPGDEWLERMRRAASGGGAAGRIGEYEILREVSRGGQGIVYQARQPHLHRDIAIKRLVAGTLASENARRRFEREVDTVSRLHHPNIVTVYGADVVDGQPLLAMEWIDGVPINKWCRPPGGQARPVAEVVDLFLRVCDAVVYAHQRGVIHRDLKPGNILVVEDAHTASRNGTQRAPEPPCSSPSHGCSQPKVLDFGLAKLMDENRDSAAHMTLSGEFVGTPAYASPEQMRADAHAVDARTDIYSLGVILYEALTGRLPIDVSGNLAALIERVQHATPAWPSAMDRRVDRELDLILLKALEKEPERRYATADALAEDLRRYRAGRPILAHPPSAWYAVRKFVRRNPLASGLLGALAAAILVFAVVAAVLAVSRQRAIERALDENAHLRQANAFYSDFFGEVLRQKSRGGDVDLARCVELAAESFENRRVDPGHEALDLGPLKARCYQRLGMPDRAETCLRGSLTKLEQAGRGDGPDAAEILNELGKLLVIRGDAQAGAEALLRCLAIREKRLGSDASSTVEARINLSAAYQAAGRLDEACSLLRQTLARIDQAGSYSRNRGIAEMKLARIEWTRGEAAEATRLLDAAIASLRSAATAAEDLAGALHAKGELFMQANRYADAQPPLREARSIRQAAGDEAGAADSAYSLGLALWATGELGEAERLIRKGSEFWAGAGPQGRQRALEAEIRLAALLIDRGRPEEAEPMLIAILDALPVEESAYAALRQATERILQQARAAKNK